MDSEVVKAEEEADGKSRVVQIFIQNRRFSSMSSVKINK